MDGRLLKHAAQSSVLLMIAVVILSVVVTDYRGNLEYVMAMDDKTTGRGAESSGLTEDQTGNDLLVDADANDNSPDTDASPSDLTTDDNGTEPVYAEKNIPEEIGERYLVVPKNESQTGEAVLTEQCLYRTIELTVDGVEKFTWGEDSVLRCQDGITYEGVPEPGRMEIYMDEYLYMDEEPAEPEDETEDEDEIGDEDESGEKAESDKAVDGESDDANEDGEASEEDAVIEESGDVLCAVQTSYDADSRKATISITLDHLYVPFLYEDEENYYIDLKRPRDVYDKILVIDAGHGGRHPGTTSKDRNHLEKNFNLDIVLKLKELLDAQPDIKVYYTRLTDTSVYLRPRVDLANEAQADFFISVHNNAYWDRYAYGTEVLYNERQESAGDGTVDSKKLASLCLEEVTGLLGTRNRGLSAGSETFIIGHSEVPVALVEVGYLTNRDDLAMLLEEENIALTAQGIYHAIMRAYEAKTK